MSNFWTTGDTYKVYLPNGEEAEFDEPIGAQDVKDAAKGVGIKKFNVFDEDDYRLFPEDFPYEGNVQVREYNEAK